MSALDYAGQPVPGSAPPDIPAQIQSRIADLESGLAGGAQAVSLRLLRQLSVEYPEIFFRIAAQRIVSGEDSPAQRKLAEMLLRQDRLFEYLVNPRLCPCRTAVALFRELLTLYPTLDFRFARMLPPRGESPNGGLSGTHAARALEILDQTSPGQRLLSLVGHLPNSPDPRISARAALFVGRRVKNSAWLQKQLYREDPRVRANAVESVWGSKSVPSIRILEECAEDSSHRVAANALIGLHMAGSPDVTMRTISMSLSDDPARRSAAAWVMGKIGNPDFVDSLTELMRDPSPKVRSTAVRSLAELSRAESKRLEAEAAALASEPLPLPPEPELPDEETDTDPFVMPVPSFSLVGKK